jgi:hypothetical protein
LTLFSTVLSLKLSPCNASTHWWKIRTVKASALCGRALNLLPRIRLYRSRTLDVMSTARPYLTFSSLPQNHTVPRRSPWIAWQLFASYVTPLTQYPKRTSNR